MAHSFELGREIEGLDICLDNLLPYIIPKYVNVCYQYQSFFI